ncbi:Peptidase M48 [uncultured Caudovirales phage]|uniref:Peptidase M48 n=1 Tax=uncultured Caudovirales phage TaxID=2100421 RepID=A0A6J7XAV3_9CAUD|nr:Peptidase M48 [uncultured Caudovirales phage]CAB5228141.1 Peptidase M48 [uncultured Caudovirales phage]
MSNIVRLFIFKTLFCVSAIFLIVNTALADEAPPQFYDLPPSVQTIANKLAATAGRLDIEFAEMNVPYSNAFSFEYDGYKVAITTGYLLYSIHETGDYRFAIGTLAHEIGHIVLGHTKQGYSNNEKANRNDERAADYYGIELMWKAGYDCAYDVQDWAALVREHPMDSTRESSTHPASQERLDSSIKMCNSLKAGNGVPTDMYFE